MVRRGEGQVRVVVCGGRNYADKARVWIALDGLMPEEVAQGGASGADQHARDWCIRRKVRCSTFYAQWDQDGPAAGPIRNQYMLDEFKPDLVLAFPGGKESNDVVRKANRARIKVVEFRAGV